MTWQFDPAHSSVTISAKHMMVTTVRGTLAVKEIDVAFDPEAPQGSSVTAVLDASSIDTGQGQRDAHLRSPDFLDVERFPEITFRSTAIEPAGKAWRLHGDLTIRDVTHPVTLDAEITGVIADMRGGRRAAVAARTRIPRETWGLTWNVALESGGWLVGKELGVEIDLALVEPAAEQTVEVAA
jgi:polyisoprenoid-binding protein YceI